MTILPTAERQSPPSQETQKFRTQMGHISRHSTVFFAGTLFTTAAGYLFKVYLARKLGAEALGIYALGMTIIGFIGLFAGLGLPQAAVRFVSLYTATGKVEELRSFIVRSCGLLVAINLAVGAVVVVKGPWVGRHFYHTPALDPYFKFFALIMLTGALTTFFGQILQGYKDVSRRTLITNFLGTPLMMLLTVGLVTLGKGLWGYLAAQVMGAAIVVVMLIVAVWKLSPAGARHLRGALAPIESQVFVFGAAVFGVGLLEFFLAQADKILIGVYINAQQVGIYSVAMAIVAFVPIALQSVNQIFSPIIADLHGRGERELLGRLFQTLTKWILALTLPVAVVTIVFARPLMRIFGPAFEVGWIVLIIGTLGQLINCGTGPVGYLLLMSGHQGRLIRVQAAMAAVTLLLNALLIPRLGITGAALASAITNAVTNTWYLLELRSSLHMSAYNRSYLRLLLPAVACVATALALRSTFAAVRPEWIVIALSGAVTMAVLLGVTLAMGLSEDDKVIANAVIARFRS